MEFSEREPNRADVACCHGDGKQGVAVQVDGVASWIWRSPSPDDLGSGIKGIPGEKTCAGTIPRQ